MRNRDRETRMKWDDRSTLFPDGLRLKAPVRSQHHDVCRAHACRETTRMTTDHYTRSPDTPPRAMASDPHVRARREGEAFLPSSQTLPCLPVSRTIQLRKEACLKPALAQKKGGTNNHGTPASVVSTAAPAHGQVRHVAPSNSTTTSNSFLQTQNSAQCLPRDPRDVLRQHICHVIRTEHFL